MNLTVYVVARTVKADHWMIAAAFLNKDQADRCQRIVGGPHEVRETQIDFAQVPGMAGLLVDSCYALATCQCDTDEGDLPSFSL